MTGSGARVNFIVAGWPAGSSMTLFEIDPNDIFAVP
jgi:hypothetical protein